MTEHKGEHWELHLANVFLGLQLPHAHLGLTASWRSFLVRTKHAANYNWAQRRTLGATRHWSEWCTTSYSNISSDMYCSCQTEAWWFISNQNNHEQRVVLNVIHRLYTMFWDVFYTNPTSSIPMSSANGAPPNYLASCTFGPNEPDHYIHVLKSGHQHTQI